MPKRSVSVAVTSKWKFYNTTNTETAAPLIVTGFVRVTVGNAGDAAETAVAPEEVPSIE